MSTAIINHYYGRPVFTYIRYWSVYPFFFRTIKLQSVFTMSSRCTLLPIECLSSYGLRQHGQRQRTILCSRTTRNIYKSWISFLVFTGRRCWTEIGHGLTGKRLAQWTECDGVGENHAKTPNIMILNVVCRRAVRQCSREEYSINKRTSALLCVKSYWRLREVTDKINITVLCEGKTAWERVSLHMTYRCVEPDGIHQGE